MGAGDGAVRVTKGGRGARERILKAAVELFAGEGIHTTGIAKLTDVAHVSTRTFYQHFPSKEALVTAYLLRIESEANGPAQIETVLDRKDLSPRERLLGLFNEPQADAVPGNVVRGCPFHNAAVEAAGALPEAAAVVERHKTEFSTRLIETAAEAGARNPDALGQQLALVFEGARALSTSLNDARPFAEARKLATSLIDSAAEPA